uniref:Uncharacterized protein n=1 Tax=Anguilla anguilla TaxID=7936 RepID=A0A0E9RCL1_ANGAN
MGLRSGLCAGRSCSSTPILTKPFLYGPHCVSGGFVMLKQEKALFQIVATKLEAQNHLECQCIKICLHWN